MSMGNPANEPDNPDGCRIDRESVRRATSSITNLAEVFTRAARAIELSVRQMIQSFQSTSGRSRNGNTEGSNNNQATGARGRGESGGRIELPFNMRIWEATRKRQISDQEKESKEIIKNAKDGLDARNAIAEQEEREIIRNAMQGLRARNAIRDAAEAEATALAREEEREIIRNAMQGLRARNAIRDAQEKAEQDEEKQITENATRLLRALNRRTNQRQKDEEKAAEAERKEIERNAIRGLSARNALQREQEKAAQDEADARNKFYADQHRELMKQAPIAYLIGRAIGTIAGGIGRIAGFADGGSVQYFASGGEPKGSDTVPAMLTPGEFVVSKKAAQQNRGELEAMNNGNKKKKTGYYAAGGLVAAGARAIGGAARGAGAAGRGAAAGLEALGFQGAANAMTRISAGAERVISSFNLLNLATLGPVDSFNKLVGFAGSFVEAVNPALMQQLSMAFKDLQAIIGMGLQPIIAAAIPIVRAFADKLQPVMQALMPTFDKLAQSMIELSGPIITLVIEMFGALEPVIETVSVSIQAFAGILTAITPIIAAVFKELIYRITQIVTTFQWFIGKIISWIEKVTGGDTGKKLMESATAASKTADLYYQGESKVQKAIEQPVKKGASAGAAARSATFSGISDFGKNLMQQAFSSSTQAAALRTAEYSEKTYNELAKLNQNMGRGDPAAPAAGVRR